MYDTVKGRTAVVTDAVNICRPDRKRDSGTGAHGATVLLPCDDGRIYQRPFGVVEKLCGGEQAHYRGGG